MSFTRPGRLFAGARLLRGTQTATSRASLFYRFASTKNAFQKPDAPRFIFHHRTWAMISWAGAACCFIANFILVENGSKSTPSSEPFSASHFTSLPLTSSEDSGPDTKLLTLTVPPHMRPYLTATSKTPIWSVFIKDDDIQVERPYTPLDGVDESGLMKFWIKKYPKGEVGRWLHSKKIGENIEVRGPLQTWAWQEDMWDEVVLVRRTYIPPRGHMR